MKSVLILSILLVVVFSHSFKLEEQLLRDLWDQWKLHHQKVYTFAQEDSKFTVFADNYLQILEFNALNSEVSLGLNQFADLTHEEFESRYLGLKVNQNNHKNVQTQVFSTSDLPDSWDWREKGAVNEVKSQGGCGSCWTFSATSALEGLHFINTGKLLSFSEQNLVDCAHGSKNESNGCQGGFMQDAFEWTAENGIQLEADYPYMGEDQVCQADKSKAVKVNGGAGYRNVTANDPEQLKAAIVQQPVSVAVQADFTWFFYKAGVIRSSCGAELNHGITAVGYGRSKGVEAFIVRNSWGAGWGDNGYVHISTEKKPNNGRGVCGILIDSSFPTNN